jgi:RES domain-containing protein
MRHVYRIAPAKYTHDLLGTGARLVGGRWNKKDIPVIYTSESISLAAMEYLVHTTLTNIPDNLQVVKLSIPDTIAVKQINISELPTGWNLYPAQFTTIELGSNWVISGETLLLRVPSAVIPHEFNIVINPAHPDMRQVQIVTAERFNYDERLQQSKP